MKFVYPRFHVIKIILIRGFEMKIGRNDMCPCGSGKKYKKCCLNKTKSLNLIKYYNYIVVYNGGSIDASVPLLQSNDHNVVKEYHQGRMHQFDPELIPIIPALNYCLHLPRFECDTYDVDTTIIDDFKDVAHDILIIPSAIIRVFHFNPTLIIYDDNCNADVVSYIKSIESELGSVPISQLSESLLIEHWKKLSTIKNITNTEVLEEIDCQHIFDDDRRVFLPASFISRQYKNAKKDYGEILTSSNVFSTSVNTLWKQRSHHEGLMKCKEEILNPQIMQILTDEINMAKRSKILEVVIVLPGVPSRQKKLYGLSDTLPPEEKEIIQLIGFHRSIARQAIYIELPTIDDRIYKELNDLELHCKAQAIRQTREYETKYNNDYILRILRNIGKWFWDQLTSEQKQIICLAKHLTVFSDFPLGLSIVENTDVPLHNYLDISYKPLSPLTRCLQLESQRCIPVYLNRHCKILFAECVPNNEQNETVRKHSSMIVHSLKQGCERNSVCEIIEKETLSIASLKKFIQNNPDADILIISAHGKYVYENNMAGLMIGEEFWMGNDDDLHLPPIVINSACHTSPRGFGCVSVADLFLRLDAKAVLSSFIPISASRNSILLSRFFSYLFDSINGDVQFNTLLECWTHVVGTNLFLELAKESKGFSEWLNQTNPNGVPHMTDFMLNRSAGRLHKQIIYQDTCDVIKEMLKEDGLEGKFDNLLSEWDFFSECSFYQWLGAPENIFLRG